jgi:hypothetical protein
MVWMVFWQTMVGEVPPLFKQREQEQQAAADASTQAASPETGSTGGAARSSSGGSSSGGSSSGGSSSGGSSTGSSGGGSSSGSGSGNSSAWLAPSDPMPSLFKLPWRRFLTNRAFIGLMCAHSMFGSGHYIILSWLPSFYSDVFHLDVSSSATLSIFPW